MDLVCTLQNWKIVVLTRNRGTPMAVKRPLFVGIDPRGRKHIFVPIFFDPKTCLISGTGPIRYRLGDPDPAYEQAFPNIKEKIMARFTNHGVEHVLEAQEVSRKKWWSNTVHAVVAVCSFAWLQNLKTSKK